MLKTYNMGTLTTDQKKSLAKELYIQGTYTYAEIAEKVGSTRQTISKWAEQGKWDELKTYMTAGRESILKGLYAQIDMINQCVKERGKLVDLDRKDPNNKKYDPNKAIQMGPTAQEADKLVKLANAIKKLENDCGIAGLVDAGMRFINYMRTVDLEEAKKIAKFWDIFLTEQMS